MKGIIILFVFFSTTLFNGCYTIVSLEEEPEQLAESTTLDDESSGSYFDEENSGDEIVNNDMIEQETEPGFWEILVAGIISELSDISYSNEVIIYSSDSDNSSDTEDNPTTERENSSPRHTGDRNYDRRR
jgi:hypothetical protein